jgi:DNA-binding NarL/FixJ family response regulator
MLRALVISPYPTVRAGLRSLLDADAEIQVALEAPAPPEPERLAALAFDVALVDEAGAPGASSELGSRAPELGVVLLGGEPTRRLGTWDAAARGYLPRDAGAEEVVSAVRAVARGLTVLHPALVGRLLSPALSVSAERSAGGSDLLTPRELEVLQLLATGLPNKTVAVRLGISEHTVKFHVSSLMAKLDASSRTEAVTTAAHRGLLML